MEKLDRALEVLDKATKPLAYCGIILILVGFPFFGAIIGFVVNNESNSLAIAGRVIGFLLAVLGVVAIWWVFLDTAET